MTDFGAASIEIIGSSGFRCKTRENDASNAFSLEAASNDKALVNSRLRRTPADQEISSAPKPGRASMKDEVGRDDRRKKIAACVADPSI